MSAYQRIARFPRVEISKLTPRQALRLWMVIGVSLNSILAALSFIDFGLGSARVLLIDFLAVVIPLATAHLCFKPIAKGHRRIPSILGWISLSVSATGALVLIQAFGGTAYFDLTLVAVGRYAPYPLLMLSLLLWPSPYHLRGHRFRALLDMVVGAAGLWAFLWVFVVGPQLNLLAHGGPSSIELTGKVFEFINPLLDLCLVIGLFQICRRAIESESRLPSRMVWAAGAFVVMLDSFFAHSTVGPISNGILHSEWPFVCTILNLAGYAYLLKYREVPVRELIDNDIEVALAIRPWYSLAPYTLVPAIGFLILYSGHHKYSTSFEAGLWLCLTVMILCLLLRQFLAIKDNANLLMKTQGAVRDLRGKTVEVNRVNEELSGVLTDLATRNAELANANSRLEMLVTIDGMTGLENHRAFQQHLRLEVEASRKHRHPLSLIMADVDYFKRYNDEFGHPAGDEVLRQIAKIIIDEVGEDAYPARYGGEEFAIVLPYRPASEAMQISDRLGKAIAGKVRLRRRITMSFGIATLEPTWTAETLVSQADRALYAAKSWGRNRSVSVSDLDRQRLSLDLLNEGTSEFDPNEPMGLAAILSAGLRNHPQALGIEPDSQIAGGLLGTLELKDVETRDHSERVMWYAMRLAQSIIENGIATMTHQDLRSLAYGALLHDIGKIGVSENILKFPGKLDAEMKAVIREHPRLGAQIVQRFPNLDLALAVIRNHHEQWDGRGYPSGLRGTDIPLVARIFTVVDGLEAMTSKRPYSDPRSIEEVTERLHAEVGTMYDPGVIRAFMMVPAEQWIKIREREINMARTIGEASAL